MHSNIPWSFRLAAGLALLAVCLAGCSPAVAPGPSPTPITPVIASLTPAAATASPVPSPVPATETVAPAETATGPASPVPSVTAAPATEAPATPDPALAAILSYLEARAKADVALVTDLSCAAWKSQAVTEAISFRSMNARLEDVACTVTGSDGAFTLVGCGGKIVTTYGKETRDWDLSTFVYQAMPEDGVWKMCGYN